MATALYRHSPGGTQNDYKKPLQDLGTSIPFECLLIRLRLSTFNIQLSLCPVAIICTSCNTATKLGTSQANSLHDLFGCETWSLILREEKRLGVFKNGVLWKMFGPKIKQVTGERRIHNGELRHLCNSPNMRKIGWTGRVARMEGK
jgi:hypothetical protein